MPYFSGEPSQGGKTKKAAKAGLRGLYAALRYIADNIQWNLYCLVHNIEKLAQHGYARLSTQFDAASMHGDHRVVRRTNSTVVARNVCVH
jgi:hypothetical protein